MEITATARLIRMSPRKLRLVADAVRGVPAGSALEKLDFIHKSAAKPLAKLISSAMANAGQKNLKAENLKVKNILVDEGSRLKRQDKSHGIKGSRGLIQKRISQIKVILEG